MRRSGFRNRLLATGLTGSGLAAFRREGIWRPISTALPPPMSIAARGSSRSISGTSRSFMLRTSVSTAWPGGRARRERNRPVTLWAEADHSRPLHEIQRGRSMLWRDVARGQAAAHRRLRGSPRVSSACCGERLAEVVDQEEQGEHFEPHQFAAAQHLRLHSAQRPRRSNARLSETIADFA